MQNKFKLFSATTVVVLSATAVVAAIATHFDIETFESDFIKSLKEKIGTFSNHTRQDRIYVQTDKSFYKPGETIWFTAYVRDAETLKPSSKSDIVHVEFITPKGSVEKHHKIVARNGAAQGDFDLSAHPGGIYKIKAYTEWQKNALDTFLFEKEITVQSVVMPRMKMKLDFEKKAYGKGDEVVAKLSLNTNENKPLGKTKVKFTAQLDGKPLSENSATTDVDGKVNLRFSLPKDLNSIDGIVNALIDFEGSTESISRSVPIVLNKISMEFFPEGGDMVATVTSRIGFRAVNEFSKPADVEGIIVDSKGAFVVKFSSYHFGMGAVDFTPLPNEAYKARITKPEGILDEFNLPGALKNGYTLRISNENASSLQLSIFSWQNEQLSLVAQTRGKISYARSFNAAKGTNDIVINTKDFPTGISQITLFDSKKIARCERLVFVNKEKQLNISVTTDKQQYQPREKVSMNIRVTDENGLPVSGNFSLSVVDDNLLSFADDKQGTVLSKILLEPELKEKVEEPNFYFDKKEEKADKALDLLMMTSGWRKYSWKQILDEDFPEIKFIGEKAELSGTILDASTSKPVSGAILKLKESGRTTTTDKDGKFLLSKFDISRNNQIEIIASNYQAQTQHIYNYASGIVYYLLDKNHVYYRYDDRVPMAVGGAMEMRNMANAEEILVEQKDLQVVELAALKVATKKEKGKWDAYKVDEIKEGEVDWENKPKDVENDIEAVPQGDGFMADTIVGADIADARWANQMAVERKADLQPVSFYRAKEFPKKKYLASDTTRNDFAPTIYWNGNVVTDNSGKAKVEFVTNDLVTSLKTTIEGFGDDGSIGRAEYAFTTNILFSMDAKVPVELVSGDKLMIPLFIKNNSGEAVSGSLRIVAPSQVSITQKNSELTISANQTKVVYLEATALPEIGEGSLEIKFTSPKHNDALTRRIKVVAKGFPASISISGQDLEKDFGVNPVNVIPGSMKIVFNAYPNIMTELMSGVESILREPYGCFEQTSSSNYPNIMVLSYLNSMKVDDPKLREHATKLLDAGYKKLVAYETKENGYEWFGSTPAHEALTAYGLMEFEDMKKVYSGVDDRMIERTIKLLLDKRDGNGGFKKNPRALDSFGGADEDITNAYIVYALSEAGYKDIAKELDAVFKEAKKNSDPYLMALVANALFNVGDKNRGEEMISLLIKERNAAGFWSGKKHSITRSTGEGLKTETTSLILMALLKSQSPDVTSVTSAVKFLVGARSGYGGFGSTQATILALKALTKYAEFSKKTDEAGTIELLVNGKVVATKEFARGERNNISIDGLEKFVGQGKQVIGVHFKGCKQALPYAMNISYSTSLPESSKNCVVNLETKVSAKQVKVGETLRLSATLKNKTNEGQPMTMAIIGIPAGFSAQPWQLKEMQEKGVIDFYEIIGNNIACYYRDLAPNEQKQINFDLKAEVPGEYDAPASSAYLYYTSENKDWVGLERVFVSP